MAQPEALAVTVEGILAAYGNTPISETDTLNAHAEWEAAVCPEYNVDPESEYQKHRPGYLLHVLAETGVEIPEEYAETHAAYQVRLAAKKAARLAAKQNAS